ncbi:methyl-accepting chemotaxis protein [Aureimonas sp. SK2]|uniref:methyl-accepting chemotaxis protein n=1 Tax=Aureimonas sp. SK2 TaxID=3015992 RepID=UPI00244481F3|nr:methyl-accepting chemotaxis protein [Aureimonas sp. SK2]
MTISIKTRLVACLAGLGIAVCLNGLIGFASLHDVEGRLQSVVENRVVPLQQLKEAADMYAVNIVDATHKTRSGAFTWDEASASVAAAETSIARNWQAYLATELTPQAAVLAEQAKADMLQANKGVTKLKGILASRDVAGLDTFVSKELYPVIDPVSTAIGKLVALQIDVARKDYAIAAEDYRSTLGVMAAIAAFSLAIFAFAVATTIRQVTSPMGRMTEMMRRLAAGDHTAEVPDLRREDEIGEMAKAVQVFKEAAIEQQRLEAAEVEAREAAMAVRERQAEIDRARTEDLGAFVSCVGESFDRLSTGDLTVRMTQRVAPEFEPVRAQFNGSIEKLEHTIGAVVGSIGAIRTGLNEINVASSDLAQRTEQQAAGLEETVAALGEVTRAVNETAENANQARTSAQKAQHTAQNGGEIVGRAIEAMQTIEQSSAKIGDIIGVIDEIAFQTNLLALNAGVEAARAGEAGRGFAVVAQEVRGLAQRSAEAAKEIKTLIQASSKQVASGAELVSASGNSLSDIIVEVGQVSRVVSEIAQRAKEQAVSLREVSTAADQMDKVTQQNAAMVEQATAAAQTLANETDELARLIAEFKTAAAANHARQSERAVQRTERSAPRTAAPTARTARHAVQMKPVAHGNAALKTLKDEWAEF